MYLNVRGIARLYSRYNKTNTPKSDVQKRAKNGKHVQKNESLYRNQKTGITFWHFNRLSIKINITIYGNHREPKIERRIF